MKNDQVLVSLRQHKLLGEVDELCERDEMVLVAFAHVVEEQLRELGIFYATIPVSYAVGKRFLIGVQRVRRFDLRVVAERSEELLVNGEVDLLLVIHLDQHQLAIQSHVVVIVVR